VAASTKSVLVQEGGADTAAAGVDHCWQARSQHFNKGGHDDGGTEGPERARRRRGRLGLGRGAIALPSMGVWGHSPQKIFEKSTLKLHIFLWFYQHDTIAKSS